MKQTFDPILEESSYQNKYFAIIPVPEPGTEVILYASKSGNEILISQKPGIKPRDIYKGKYDRKIIVDMHMHEVSFGGRYDSKHVGVYFIINVEAAVKVAEADVVWKSGIHDVAGSLQKEMEDGIRDAACQYEISEKVVFQRDLKQLLGNVYLVGTGLQISGISYTVSIDEKYSEILEKGYYESQRSKAAEEMHKMYKDSAVAIFAEAAEGKISPSEAYELVQNSLSSNFDERMRQLREATKFVDELRTKEFVNNEQITMQMERILGGLLIADGSIGEGGASDKRISDIKSGQKEAENDEVLYKPFDD